MNSRWRWQLSHEGTWGETADDTRRYWVALWEIACDPDNMDEFPPYVVLMRPDAAGVFVSPNVYHADPDDDIGPYKTWQDAVSAAEMLILSTGWDYNQGENDETTND